MQVSEGQQVQIVQAAQGQAQTAQPQGQTMQVMQQIITNTGEIQQIPVRKKMKKLKQQSDRSQGRNWWWSKEAKTVDKLVKFLDNNPFSTVWCKSSNVSFAKLLTHQRKVNDSGYCCPEKENGCDLCVGMTFAPNQTLSPPCVGQLQVQLNTGQLQYIRLAQPVSGAQVVQGQIQTLANTQQVITVATKIASIKQNIW